jgi:hypothetical protein
MRAELFSAMIPLPVKGCRLGPLRLRIISAASLSSVAFPGNLMAYELGVNALRLA